MYYSSEKGSMRPWPNKSLQPAPEWMNVKHSANKSDCYVYPPALDVICGLVLLIRRIDDMWVTDLDSGVSLFVLKRRHPIQLMEI